MLSWFSQGGLPSSSMCGPGPPSSLLRLVGGGPRSISNKDGGLFPCCCGGGPEKPGPPPPLPPLPRPRLPSPNPRGAPMFLMSWSCWGLLFCSKLFCCSLLPKLWLPGKVPGAPPWPGSTIPPSPGAGGAPPAVEEPNTRTITHTGFISL